MTKQEISELLRRRGVCPTHQRVAVYAYLTEHSTHPTADTIYRSLITEYPTFSRTTVYNTAHALAKAGLIRIITISKDEQRFDGNVSDHGHFYCSGCDTVYDFPLSSATVENLVPSDFLARTLDVYAAGLCPTCRNPKQYN